MGQGGRDVLEAPDRYIVRVKGGDTHTCTSPTSTHLQEDTQSMGWLPAAIKIVPIIWQAVITVERLIKDRKGKDKQDEAVRMTGELLALIEVVVGRDLVGRASCRER